MKTMHVVVVDTLQLRQVEGSVASARALAAAASLVRRLDRAWAEPSPYRAGLDGAWMSGAVGGFGPGLGCRCGSGRGEALLATSL